MRLGTTSYSYRIYSAIFLFIVYAFGIFTKSAWSDDYSSLIDPNGVALHATRDGRPLLGWLIHLFYEEFNSISALIFIRIFGFLGLLLLQDLILKNLLKFEVSLRVAVAVMIAFTLPSFQFSAHWAGAFVLLWSAYLAVLGFELQKSTKPFKKIAGIFALVSSFLIYPLYGFFLFAYIYCLWLVQNQSTKSLTRELIKALCLLFGSASVSYLIAYLYLRAFDLSFNPRVGLISLSSLPEKIFFFFSRPFALTYRPFFTDSPSIAGVLATAVLFIALLLILFWFRYRNLRLVVQNFSLFNLFIVFTLMPLLAVSDNQIDLRFVTSNTWLYMFVVVFLALPKNTQGDKSFRQLSGGGNVLVIASLLIIGLVSVNMNYITFYRDPFLEKQAFLAGQLATCSSQDIFKQVTIIKRSTPWGKKNVIGAYSQQSDLESEWVPVGAVYYYLKDIGLETQALPILAEEKPNGPGCFVVLDNYPKQ